MSNLICACLLAFKNPLEIPIRQLPAVSNIIMSQHQLEDLKQSDVKIKFLNHNHFCG